MNGPAVRLLPYFLAFFSSLCIMVLELVASRLVARHVGASLNVWTSVIGVMLGGICLGNYLGGRLADRVDPRRAVGPLYTLGALLTLTCLWANITGGSIPESSQFPWFRSIALVIVDFLIPGTVLGMVSPVVAKIAVEQARRTGSAIGDVYTLGAVGSIVGTFIGGFYLMYLAPTSAIVMIVAAGLALLGAAMSRGIGRILGFIATALLGVGSMPVIARTLGLPNFLVAGEVPLNPINAAGQVVALLSGLFAVGGLIAAGRASEDAPRDSEIVGEAKDGPKPKLTDLAVLSFIISMAFMSFEMTAGRLVTRHLGSSIYGWTSVIAVLLGGLSLGNFLGGKIADSIKSERGASWLFVFASFFVLTVLVLETPPRWLVSNPIGHFLREQPAEPLFDGSGSSLSQAIVMWPGYFWGYRVLMMTFVTFFLPAVSLGTVSPILAKLAVDRFRAGKQTGAAIGGVYAWGMVGSIVGTFLTSFVLIDFIGTKGVILLIGTMLALSATFLGSIFHAAWAGIPLGLCVIAFIPLPMLERQGLAWGIREDKGDPTIEDEGKAWIDESDYYYIKVENEPDADGAMRTLVLDNLIHGYFVLGHPERIKYEYEHIYALITHRVARAKVVAAHKAEYDAAAAPEAVAKLIAEHKALHDSEKDEKARAKLVAGWVAESREALIQGWMKQAGLSTMFLGGGAYTFPRHLQFKYPGTRADVAEIDPAVTNANKIALGLGSNPLDNEIETTFGDARQFVERNQSKKQYDLIYGDAFNDFSVPWHLTTKEFNDKLATMLAPEGVYMINIIDVYRSDERANVLAERSAKKAAEEAGLDAPTPEMLEAAKAKAQAEALRNGGFLGSWTETAKLTFPHVYVFGTAETPGEGTRETFVVVASRVPLDLDQLGARDDDPKFFSNDRLFEPRPYPEVDMKAISLRSRGIILTDDYAPVENLLAPVAETRGED
ncbi:MAG: fused MFS/spermidine synthase [Isosphaeraceae bacterium]|nr:fused MFS/spermidine synthase [Isosphaeraceae bacterium]